MKKALRIQVRHVEDPVVQRAVRMLERETGERAGIAVEQVEDGPCDLCLDPCADVGGEGFRIDDAPDGAICVSAGNPRGLVYGLGKFLRDAAWEPGRLTPGTWRGESAPVQSVRGMYFATHFYNWYHTAPGAEIDRYIEELALWGCNSLLVWFDMHHFSGIDDPAAAAMIERLHRLLAAANSAGMGGGLLVLANEAYATSPEELRADWTVGHDGYTHPPPHYHVEVCPHKPGGLEYILARRAEMFDAFADLNVESVCIWPYDQGGCTCSECVPWGANGFLACAEPVAKEARKRWPGTRIILSTWHFDTHIEGEWEGLSRGFDARPPTWVDCLMTGRHARLPEYPREHGVPGGLPMLSFPEISMRNMTPWGGFGANPQPRYWGEHGRNAPAFTVGGFPYSEGIYEDINKALLLQSGWNPDVDLEFCLREYARAYWTAEVAEDFARLALLLESDLPIRSRRDEQGNVTVQHEGLPYAEEAERLAKRIDARIPPARRAGWRWRIVFLRAAMDAEIKRADGKLTETADRFLEELVSIYHAENAYAGVQPPARNAAPGERRERGEVI